MTKQLVEPLLLGGCVAAAASVDADVAAKHCCVNATAKDVFNMQTKCNRRRRNLRCRPRVGDRYREDSHAVAIARARSAVRAKNSSISRHTSSPPLKPRHERRIRPTSSYDASIGTMNP